MQTHKYATGMTASTLNPTMTPTLAPRGRLNSSGPRIPALAAGRGGRGRKVRGELEVWLDDPCELVGLPSTHEKVKMFVLAAAQSVA